MRTRNSFTHVPENIHYTESVSTKSHVKSSSLQLLDQELDCGSYLIWDEWSVSPIVWCSVLYDDKILKYSGGSHESHEARTQTLQTTHSQFHVLLHLSLSVAARGRCSRKQPEKAESFCLGSLLTSVCIGMFMTYITFSFRQERKIENTSSTDAMFIYYCSHRNALMSSISPP